MNQTYAYSRYDRKIKFRMVSVQHFINEAPRSGPHLLYTICGIFAMSNVGQVRLTATLASAHCAISLPKLAQILFRITGPHLCHHMWAILDSQPH